MAKSIVSKNKEYLPQPCRCGVLNFVNHDMDSTEHPCWSCGKKYFAKAKPYDEEDPKRGLVSEHEMVLYQTIVSEKLMPSKALNQVFKAVLHRRDLTNNIAMIGAIGKTAGVDDSRLKMIKISWEKALESYGKKKKMLGVFDSWMPVAVIAIAAIIAIIMLSVVNSSHQGGGAGAAVEKIISQWEEGKNGAPFKVQDGRVTKKHDEQNVDLSAILKNLKEFSADYAAFKGENMTEVLYVERSKLAKVESAYETAKKPSDLQKFGAYLWRKHKLRKIVAGNKFIHVFERKHRAKMMEKKVFHFLLEKNNGADGLLKATSGGIGTKSTLKRFEVTLIQKKGGKSLHVPYIFTMGKFKNAGIGNDWILVRADKTIKL